MLFVKVFCLWVFLKMGLDYDPLTVSANPSFMDYKLPSSQEIPEIISIPVEVPLPEGPFGAKGIGELAVVGIAPAVGNAIYDAFRVRIKDLLLFPERVLTALESGDANGAAPSAAAKR